jgi:alpha-L-rhamnosidase
MTHIPYAGAPLRSRDRVEWSVTLWDEQGEAGEQSQSWFELGLLDPADWTASWIAGDYSPKTSRRYPVDHFRKSFHTHPDPVRARLYITACGLYEAHLNGRRVGDAQLTPGSTDYRTRLHYQAYDVTELLRQENQLELQLADGWYRGSIGCFGPTNVFGRQTRVLAQLEITFADGTRHTVATGPEFGWSNDGPIRFADLKDGERVDARMTPSYAGAARPAKAPAPVPTASDNVPPRMHERLVPELVTTPSGRTVLDFGQNIAGFLEFRIQAKAGDTLDLRLGEILDEQGEFTQTNFQKRKPARSFGKVAEVLLMTGKENLLRGPTQNTPEQQIHYTCRDGENTYRTRFAVFGFRYVLVETDLEISPDDFAAVAVYSDMEQTGSFECSHPGVNRLLENTRWSMKGNFLDVPTDCPTRERLGWTGDAQVFFHTAAYLMDVAAFYRKWIRDLQDNQAPSGKVSAVAPYNGFGMLYDNTGGSVGWADAVVLIPYRFWKRYDDEALLREAYPMMRAYAQYLISMAGPKNRRAPLAHPDDAYLYERGFHLGEWLEPAEFRDHVGKNGPPRTEEATAYLHYTMRHLAEIADALDHPDDAATYQEYAEGARRAYQRNFLTADATDTDRQAKLVRPLAFDLVDDMNRARVEDRLVTAVEKRDYRVGTGFLSTPFVLPVLTDADRPDVAYRMLENRRMPGWLAEVDAGATTIWEDWEGEASHNHYSPGAVCQWLFDTVAGIRIEGRNRFRIQPTPGGSLTHASAQYLSPYGPVAVSWRRAAERVEITATVPPNTTAEVALPDGTTQVVPAGVHQFACAEAFRPREVSL